MPSTSSHYHQLQPEDRVTIASLKQQNYSVRAIARQLHRSPGTISRELQRNASSSGYGSAHEDQGQAAQCRQRAHGHVEEVTRARDVLLPGSQGQICRRLRLHGAGAIITESNPRPHGGSDRGFGDHVIFGVGIGEPSNRQGAALFNQGIDLLDHGIAAKTVSEVRLELARRRWQ